MTNALQKTIDAAFAKRAEFSPDNAPADVAAAVQEAMALLDSGKCRVAEPQGDGWRVNEWLKKATLLYFCLHGNRPMAGGDALYYDKVPSKFADYDAAAFVGLGARVVPPAAVRYGAHIGKNVVLMPSFVNIGAFVDDGTMVDTWATVGSCAQIGKNVHLSGGVGIGGVLEPLQAAPTVIEDDCFIGARSEVVEGVCVGRGSVLAMGVFISASTRIYNRATGEVLYGRVPSGSVVVPGALPAANGKYALACAVIVKTVDEKTRAKTGINELLRGVD